MWCMKCNGKLLRLFLQKERMFHRLVMAFFTLLLETRSFVLIASLVIWKEE